MLTILELLILPLLFEPIDGGAMTLPRTCKPIIIASDTPPLYKSFDTQKLCAKLGHGVRFKGINQYVRILYDNHNVRIIG